MILPISTPCNEYVPSRLFMAFQHRNQRSSGQETSVVPPSQSSVDATNRPGTSEPVDDLSNLTPQIPLRVNIITRYKSASQFVRKIASSLAPYSRFPFVEGRSDGGEIHDNSSQRELVRGALDWPQRADSVNSIMTMAMNHLQLNKKRSLDSSFEALDRSIKIDIMDPETLMEKLIATTLMEKQPVDPEDVNLWP